MKIKLLTTALTITALFFLSLIKVDENPIDRLGIKGPLKFDQTNFKLSWTAKPNENYYAQEYLPADEKPATFNQMLTLHLFVTETETKNAAQQKINELESRKKTDPLCNYVLNESPDGKEFMLDFLLGESKENKMTIAEFNVYRYKQIEPGNNKKAILVFVYSKRSYGNDITAFLSGLGKERTKYLNEMISTKIPVVKIAYN